MLNEKIKANHYKFLVHISSHFNCGYEAGSDMTSWVNRDFHTVEEKRKEYIFDDEETGRQKTCYTGMQHNKYYVRNTCSRNEIDKRRYYSMIKMKNYISEGANFVMMRYMVIARYIGTFELSTMYLNGDLCRNIYVSVL
ncbi:unnamed protein product [Brassicogethes aeneus]|uniref:Ciliogenesis-associated TTC17-interacting protein N-terminal domain-containing protein n=1 Tax=Brassicogethes aeneus TaxID=1431903 RepID=A0A9P0ATR9_BRAAE|nr:unnamed protein product [Brassicogethes aeneus]